MTVIQDDKPVDIAQNTSYEADGINIAIAYDKTKGFQVSIVDKKTDIISFYDVVDGELKLTSKECTITGKEL